MSFATQDATGKWSFIDFDEYDSAGRTLKGSIEHFSYVSKSADLQLFPHTEDVRVKGIGQFWLYNVRTKKHHFVPDNTTFTWYVNGLNLPSEVYGKISSTDLCCFPPGSRLVVGDYDAPEVVPDADPIPIQLEVALATVRNNKISRAGTKVFTSYVRTYDEYDINVCGIWDNLVSGQATERFVDSARLIVRLRPNEAETIELKNSLFILEKNYCPRKCTCEYVNRETCQGLIHIAGISSLAFEGKTANNVRSRFTHVTLNFKPAWTDFPILRVICPRSSGNTPMPPGRLPALPIFLKFELKEGMQEQELNVGQLGTARYNATIRRREYDKKTGQLR